jgi:hypothetical protein
MLLHIYDAEDWTIRETAWARSDDPPRYKQPIYDNSGDPFGACINSVVAAAKS